MTENEKIAADAIVFLCRVVGRITEFATHFMVGEDDSGIPQWDFDPMVLAVLGEDLPGSVAHSETVLVEAVGEVYPHYKATFTSALHAYDQLKDIQEERQPEYWLDGYPREIPWVQADPEAVSTKEAMDAALSTLFWRARRLYEINQTL